MTRDDAPRTPSWTWDPGVLRLWTARRESARSPVPDMVITGDLADMLCAALSWIVEQTSPWADTPPDDGDASSPYPSDGDLGDWARELRQLADRIEDTRP